MAKNLVKLTESQLEELVKKIMLEEKKTSSNKVKSSKSLNEGKELLRKFHNKKKQLVKEGYSKKQINEDLDDFLGMSSDSPTSDIFFGSAKQWIVNWILGQLNVSGELKNILSIGLSKIEPSDYVKLFDPVDNCEFIGDLMFDTFLQYAIQRIVSSIGTKSTTGGMAGGFASSDLFSIVAGNSVMRMVKNIQFKKELQKTFRKAICDALSGDEYELSSDLEDTEFSDEFIRNVKTNL